MTANGHIVSKRATAGANEGYDLYTSANGYNFYIKTAAGVTADSACGTSLTAWQHCMWFLDRDYNNANGFKAYLNGASSGTANPAAAAATHRRCP